MKSAFGANDEPHKHFFQASIFNLDMHWMSSNDAYLLVPPPYREGRRPRGSGPEEVPGTIYHAPS